MGGLRLLAAVRRPAEAQIAAGDGDSSTDEDSEDQNASEEASRTEKSKKPKSAYNVSSIKEGCDDNAAGKWGRFSPRGGTKGGLMGMFSSARSLGWKWGRKERGDDGQSQTSQESIMSFLSGGLKTLASKAVTPTKWLRTALRRGKNESQTVADTISEISFLDANISTEPLFDRECTKRAKDCWRHVRMIVHGVRGEVRGLASTVSYRSARRLQCIARQMLARKAVARRLADARAARKAGEDLRLRRRRREAEAWHRYKEACREEGRKILEWSVKCFLRPVAAVDAQRVWRGYRARTRLAAYLKWLDDRARRRREYERYLAALAAVRAAKNGSSEQVKRRVWGRVEFEHTGWKPPYEVQNAPAMHDYVWAPPRGSSSGVRTLKVHLPPRSERERLIITTDKNAWVGIPVGVAKRRGPVETLGPPPRPRTFTSEHDIRSSRNGEGGEGVGGGNGRSEDRLATRYNWLPAPLVSKVRLHQTPISSR